MTGSVHNIQVWLKYLLDLHTADKNKQLKGKDGKWEFFVPYGANMSFKWWVLSNAKILENGKVGILQRDKRIWIIDAPIFCNLFIRGNM